MRFVVQVVDFASVKVDSETVGKINKGLLVFCGISDTDDKSVADKMVKKLCNLRIFKDENGKTNLSVQNMGGSILIISQFTLYANCKNGNRPEFAKAGRPEMAEPLYNYILQKSAEYVSVVEHGIFGAHMEVNLLNNGPFTIILDSENL